MKNLAGVDLNLLVAFEALMAERNVTRAAARVGLAQPSMSNALARLRHLFDDPLLVRAAGGMEPTARALAIAEPIGRALDGIRTSLGREAPFEPARAQATIRLAASDAVQMAVLPSLVLRLQERAPGIDLRLRPMDRDAVFDDLDNGAYDFALGIFDRLPRRLAGQPLFTDRYMSLLRTGHPVLQGPWTAEQFAGLPHILTSLRDDAVGAVDAALSVLGLRRRITLTLPNFLVVPVIVAATDCVATLPKRVAQHLGPAMGCAVVEPPLDLAPWVTRLIWPTRMERSPLHAWFRNELSIITRNLIEITQVPEINT